MFDKAMDTFVSWGDKFVITIDIVSWEICLLAGLIAFILYIFGFEKGKRIATLSPAIYIIIQIFLKAMFGV